MTPRDPVTVFDDLTPLQRRHVRWTLWRVAWIVAVVVACAVVGMCGAP